MVRIKTYDSRGRAEKMVKYLNRRFGKGKAAFRNNGPTASIILLHSIIGICPGCNLRVGSNGTDSSGQRWHSDYSSKEALENSCYGKAKFARCLECGELNMSAKTNLKYGTFSCPKEQLCDTCYNRKYGLSVVTLSFK